MKTSRCQWRCWGKWWRRRNMIKYHSVNIFSLFVFFFFFFLTFLFTFLFLFTLSYSILVSRLGGYWRIVKNNSLLRCVCAHADGLACRRACIDQSTVLQVALVSTRFCLSCGSLNATGNDRPGYGWLKGEGKGFGWLVKNSLRGSAVERGSVQVLHCTGV